MRAVTVSVLALERAQWLFLAALVVVAALISFFALYVVSSTGWGNRWYRRSK